MAGGGYLVEEQPALVARLDGFLQRLGDDLRAQPWQARVRALLLAGGYGRGEGGVFRESGDAEAQLYNDLEFYLILQDGGPGAEAHAWTARWAHQGDGELSIEVEFKILREGPFRAAEPSMFYYDLLSAHRMVAGHAAWAESAPGRLREAGLIPAHEATRLLFNRGSGLYFSAVAMASSSERIGNGFVERNHAKVRLALGDAVLAINGRYHFSCVEREGRLREPLARVPPDFAAIQAWHTAGVEFKLRPRHEQPGVEELQRRQEELVAVWRRTFLWVEAERLRHPFATAREYEEYRGRLFPKTPRWRNVALHLRDRLRRKAALPGWQDYPRAALQRALVMLLEDDAPRANRWLGGAAETPLATRYEEWWRLYN